MKVLFLFLALTIACSGCAAIQNIKPEQVQTAIKIGMTLVEALNILGCPIDVWTPRTASPDRSIDGIVIYQRFELRIKDGVVMEIVKK